MSGRFIRIDQSLQLSAAETQAYDRQVSAFAPKERKTAVQLMTSWEIRGRQEGLHEGKEGMVRRLIHKRFGILTEELGVRIASRTSEQLDELGDALLDFTSLADLEQWLTKHS